MKSFVLAAFFLVSMSAFDTRSHIVKDACLSPEEMKLYELIMEYRKSKGLPSIPLSAKLSQVAMVHAHDLADNYDFDPDNKCNPHSWSKKGTWTACCYTSDHKKAQCMWDKPNEIAYYSSNGATAKEGLDGWKVSPGHNPLIINSGIWSKVKWNAIGVALYKEYGLVWFGEVEDSATLSVCK
jgi:uncharacterized protein YkwD